LSSCWFSGWWAWSAATRWVALYICCWCSHWSRLFSSFSLAVERSSELLTASRTWNGGTMDRDKVKGKMEDIKGRIKRQVGEWTGNQRRQDEGTRDQIRGKAQNAWGNVKEGARDLTDDVRQGADRMKDDMKRKDREMERDIEHKRDIKHKRDAA